MDLEDGLNTGLREECGIMGESQFLSSATRCMVLLSNKIKNISKNKY